MAGVAHRAGRAAEGAAALSPFLLLDAADDHEQEECEHDGRDDDGGPIHTIASFSYDFPL